jgi:hypothetical protein
MRLSIFSHFVFLFVISLLVAYIFSDYKGDRNAILQSEFQFSYQNAEKIISMDNKAIFSSIVMETNQNPNQIFKNCKTNCQIVLQKTDSIILALDALQKNVNQTEVINLQTKLHLFHSAMWRFLDYEPFFQDFFPKDLPIDWFFQSYKKEDEISFQTSIEEAKMNVLFEEGAIFNYFHKRLMSHYELSHEYYQPYFNPKIYNPKVGETFNADVFLGAYDMFRSQFGTYMLNGQILTTNKKGDTAPFSLKYDQPGLYPLRASVEWYNQKKDSMEMFEKTYFVRVR